MKEDTGCTMGTAVERRPLVHKSQASVKMKNDTGCPTGPAVEGEQLVQKEPSVGRDNTKRRLYVL
jgi:hypothetical protein